MNIPLRLIGIDTLRTEDDVTKSGNILVAGLVVLFMFALFL